MIDQTKLPTEHLEITLTSVEEVWEAIRSLRVRGAPAIGVAAAYGIVLGLQQVAGAHRDAFNDRLNHVIEYLAASRPTARNLFWVLDRMRNLADNATELPAGQMHKRLLEEAQQIELEDRKMCAEIGRIGAELLADNQTVLTHCNAGALATAGAGTALSVIFAAVAAGKKIHVYADETRPLLQGARLTTWELVQSNIPVTLICDSSAASVMQQKRVEAVITGADRIAANGDSANKIGTYMLAILAKTHDIPFYIAAPSSTFDLSLKTGADIPIEERSASEITESFGTRTAPDNVHVYNPAFDVTPAKYISAIITERGLIRPVTRQAVEEGIGR